MTVLYSHSVLCMARMYCCKDDATEKAEGFVGRSQRCNRSSGIPLVAAQWFPPQTSANHLAYTGLHHMQNEAPASERDIGHSTGTVHAAVYLCCLALRHIAFVQCDISGKSHSAPSMASEIDQAVWTCLKKSPPGVA